jgi:hypothetical protein
MGLFTAKFANALNCTAQVLHHCTMWHYAECRDADTSETLQPELKAYFSIF